MSDSNARSNVKLYGVATVLLAGVFALVWITTSNAEAVWLETSTSS